MSMTAIAPTHNLLLQAHTRPDVIGRIAPDVVQVRQAVERHLDVLRAAHEPSALHCERVGRLAASLAVETGMDMDAIETVYHAALLHDIGKAAIDRALLDAPRKLTVQEQTWVDLHAPLGAAMLAGDPALERLAHVIAHHHDRFEHGGTNTPLAARIIAVVDAWDAMITPRPYAGPMPHVDAADELDRCAGTQFDPDLVDAFLAMVEAPRLKLTA
jgi:putative nucleotidyltransferase with HDIG domain